MGPVTRRRALGMGAAAGLGSLLVRAATPAWAAPRAKGIGLDVPASRFGRTIRAPRRFEVVGARGRLPSDLQVRVRRRGGRWSPWVPLAHGADHRPDTGSGSHASDPVWTGGTHELQLRSDSPRELRLHLVAVPRSARRRLGRRARARASQAGPPPITPRAAWGGDSVRPREAPSYGQVQLAFVHHTVSANDYRPEDSPAMVLGIAKYHRDSNGWNDIGYNFLVDRYGQIFEGRAGGVDRAVIGAQAQGYNSVSTGIAFLGTHGSEGQTPQGLEAVSRLIAWKLAVHGAPVTGQVTVVSGGGSANRYPAGRPVTFHRISGHRDGDSTSCPGDALYGQLPAIRERAAALAPAFASVAARLLLDPLDTDEVLYGSEVVLRGRLVAPDGTPVAGRRVSVQRDRGSRWVTFGGATTADDGSFEARVTWRKGGRLRVRAAGVATSSPLSLDVLPRPELRTTARRIRAGRSLAVDTRMRPARGKADILIEREIRGRFRRVGKLSVKPRSRRRVRVPLRKPGLYRLTLRLEADGKAMRSEPVVVRAVRAGASLTPAGGGNGSTGGVAAGA